MDYNRKIKLIWEFRGPDAEQMAKHHAIHLNDFKLSENDETIIECASEKVDEEFHIAFLNTYYSEMIRLRDLLKPKRGIYLD